MFIRTQPCSFTDQLSLTAFALQLQSISHRDYMAHKPKIFSPLQKICLTPDVEQHYIIKISVMTEMFSTLSTS